MTDRGFHKSAPFHYGHCHAEYPSFFNFSKISWPRYPSATTSVQNQKTFGAAKLDLLPHVGKAEELAIEALTNRAIRSKRTVSL